MCGGRGGELELEGGGRGDGVMIVSRQHHIPANPTSLCTLPCCLGYKKCVLVGHDMGGKVAWTFAQTYPDLVDRFIVMNCPSTIAHFRHAQTGLSQLRKVWWVRVGTRSVHSALQNIHTGTHTRASALTHTHTRMRARLLRLSLCKVRR